MGWLSTIWGVIKVIAGLISGTSSTPDPTIAERKAGEDLGKAETNAATADAGIREIDVAQKARDGADVAIRSDPDGVRGADTNTSPRGADGIS